MTIKEKGYAHWEGEFVQKRFPWWPVTRQGIQMAFKKRFFKLLLFLTYLPAFVFLAGVYISERVEDFRVLAREAPALFRVSPAFFKIFLTNEYLMFMTTMVLVFAGAGLISDDLRYNSLQLYFSRPLKKREYFMGKAGVVVFFILLLTLLPGLVLFLSKLIFSGSFRFFLSFPWLPFSILGYSAFMAGFFSFYVLFLSSLSRSRRYVIILIIGLYLFSDILFGIFYGIFREKHFALLSLKMNLKQVGSIFFGQKPTMDIPWVYSFLVIVFICVLAALVLRSKVKGVEVVK